MLIGINLTFVTGTENACPVCMEPAIDTLVEWPTCPARHAFCIPCTHRMHFRRSYATPGNTRIDTERTAQESDEENAKDEAEWTSEAVYDDEDDDDEDDDEDDGEEWNNTKDCPLCRHVNILHWKK
jgi:Zn ribbon nucleic-acid-binding protein